MPLSGAPVGVRSRDSGQAWALHRQLRRTLTGYRDCTPFRRLFNRRHGTAYSVKSAADYLGWKGLEKVIGAAKGTPVLGIGGLDLGSIPSLAATGAAGLAAIGAFIPPAGQSGLSEFVKKRVIDMRFAFDSAQTEP